MNPEFVKNKFFLLMILIRSDRESVRERKKNDLRDEHDFLSQLTETVLIFIMFKLLGN